MTDDMEEIWLLYVDDGSQALDGVENALTHLKTHHEDTDAIGLLFRSMHTFKGNSRILGLASIEHVAHVAEDLIGIVRDEGVPIDEEIVELLIEAADVLRGMMDQAYQARADVPTKAKFDLPDRMKEKIASARAALAKPQPAAVPAHAPSSKTDAGGDEADLTDALLFDPSEVRLADDPVYRQMFHETARAALDRIHTAILSGDTGAANVGLEALDEIRDMAERIAMPDWPEVVGAAHADLSASGDIVQALAMIEALYDSSVASQPLQVEPTTPPAAHEAVVENSTVPSPVPREIIDALRKLLEPADAGKLLDATTVKDVADQISAWAEQNSYFGITEACASLSALPEGGALDAGIFQLAEYLSRLEDDPEAAASTLLGKWSLARAPKLLDGISEAVAGTSVDWDRVVANLEWLVPALTTCGWYTAHDVVLLMTDMACRARDGELPATAELQKLLVHLVTGIGLALRDRRANGQLNFAAADTVLDGVAAAAARLNRDPEIADLAASLGLPDAFLESFSAESAEKARAAIKADLKLHIVRADLGQDKDLAERFMSWLNSPGITVIASVTVFANSATAFDFLISCRESGPAIRAALSRITPDVTTLSLISTKSSPSGPGAPFGTVGCGLNDAAALGNIIGELATARQVTRQTLSNFVEADLPSRTARILLERAGDPKAMRDELARFIGDWHDRIEQLLQIEAKMAADLDQLSEIVTQLRQCPAGQMLNELADWGNRRADERGIAATISCSGHECSIDVSHIGSIDAVLRHALEVCLSQHDAGSGDINVRVAQGETALEAFVSVRHWTGSDEAADDPRHGQMRKAFDEILRGIAGYSCLERTQGGGMRMRFIVPLQTSLIDGMIFRVAETKYVLPVHAIQRIVETTMSDVVKVSAQSAQSLLKLSGDDVLPVQSLVQLGDAQGAGDSALAADAAEPDTASKAQLFVIALTRDGRIALPVDELLGQESIVVRPVQGYLASLHAVAGCTILAAGDVGMVVDPDALNRVAA